MRDFLIEMFGINLDANLKMVHAISKLPEPEEGIKLLSHLANCQYKWLDRINVYPEDSTLDWWKPLYTIDQLPEPFTTSTNQWTSYLSGLNEEEMDVIKHYVGYDGNTWEAKLKDIALQLIFHSFHHRAQIQTMIRVQGLKPAFIDYIGYKAKKTEAS